MSEKIKVLVSDDNQDFARTLVSYLTKDEVSRIDLTKSAFIMALTKHINGDIWK